MEARLQADEIPIEVRLLNIGSFLIVAVAILSGRSSSLSRPSQTSSTLLERIRECDQEAWVRFVDLYGPTLYGWCRAARLSDHDAADVIQETFRAVARYLDGFKRESGQKGALTAWLWKVTQSKIRNHWQRIARNEPGQGGSEAQRRLAELPDPFGDYADGESVTGDSSLIIRAAELIRPEFQDSTWNAFWRVAIDEQPTDVVAEQLGISVAAVRQANYRVRRRLRQELQAVATVSEELPSPKRAT